MRFDYTCCHTSCRKCSIDGRAEVIRCNSSLRDILPVNCVLQAISRELCLVFRKRRVQKCVRACVHARVGAMKVKVISILEDNYMYLVIEEQSKQAIAVDPAVPHRLLEIVKREDLSLIAVLTTHYHWDHARGNAALVKEIPDLKVYGADDRIEGLTDKVTDSQELKFSSINVKCLFTPCHTSGDMCYYVWEDECTDAPAVFTGDTLFIGGCGRFCEGTAEQMHHNLTKVLASLPQETKVFCGHENTIKNLKFAMLVEPENEKVKEMLSWARARDDDDKPTVPSTLREEFDYNPFLRLSEKAVQKFTGKTNPVDVMRVLRKEKDKFKKPKDRLPPNAMLALQWGLLMSSKDNLSSAIKE